VAGEGALTTSAAWPAADVNHQQLSHEAYAWDETVSIAAWPEMKEFFIKLIPLPASAAAERLIRNYIQKFQFFSFK